jgi:DNA-directed RNA polymerase specialized sigma24 family protein
VDQPRAESLDRGFEAFYVAAYPRVTAALVRVTGSRHEAEDVAQEAFSRLVPRWDRIRRYDDPEAWVRAVAFRIMTSRWRRTRTAAATLLRLGPAPHVPAPTAAGVTVDAVLAALSVEHRQVLVLHHGLDLSIDEIARELQIAPGTVKSRLSRARAAAAAVAGGSTDD